MICQSGNGYAPRAFATASTVALSILASLVSLPSQAQRGPISPFASLAGYWSGGGSIAVADGARERIRCRATYAIDASGMRLQQNLRCASDSYRFDVNSDLLYTGGLISGTWTETTRNASGNVTGHASDSHISGTVVGPGFSAGLAVQTKGNQQTVNIRPQGATDVVDVSVALRKE
jgi:hypothetical protein